MYYKIFITLNKNKIEEFQKQVANSDKKDIIANIQQRFSQSFNALLYHV